MVEIGSNITGLEELARNVKSLKKSFATSTLRTALRNGAAPVRKIARANVAVDRGDLKKAIRTKATVKRNGFGYADIGFDRTEFHGLFVELGTSQQAARPFLRPALDEGERSGAIIGAFIGAINKTVMRLLGK